MRARHEAWAVIVAGGTGQRFSASENKLLLPLHGKAVIQWTVEAFLQAETIDGLIIVSHPDAQGDYEAVVTRLSLEKPIVWALGGPTRRASAYNGLSALSETVKVVAIHDAARPLIPSTLINHSVEGISPPDVLGTVVSLPLVDTVKAVDPVSGQIQGTLDRNTLWRAQTPQTFWKDSILQAHQAIGPEVDATDDAQLMELAGLGPVVTLKGPSFNLKITAPDDLLQAEQWLRSLEGLRT